MQVFKSDFSNAPDGYALSTDYTGTASVGTINRLSGGSITSGDEVVIEYNEAVDAQVVNAGGSLVDFEGVLLLVHELNTGKALQIKLRRSIFYVQEFVDGKMVFEGKVTGMPV